MSEKPSPSAAYLVGGIVMSAFGGPALSFGLGMNAAEVVSKYGSASHPGTALLVIGAILLICGAVLFSVGMYRLAAGVDYLVKRTGAPVDAPAKTTS